MELEGKVVVVTGAARRVGRAIAKELGQAGASVVVHYHRSSEEATKVVATLPRSVAVQADLSDLEGCRVLIDAVRSRHRKLDILVNSAARYSRSPFAYEKDETWQELFALNLMAPARLIRMALPLGLSSVINIVDVAAEKPWKHHAAYAATKAGLLQLTKNLALELAPAVRVNAVAPGTVVFPEDFSPSERAAVVERIPLGRIGAPTDVARAVRYLSQEEFLTGTVISVDGGAGLK